MRKKENKNKKTAMCELCNPPLPNSHVDVLIPVPLNVTLPGNRVTTDVIVKVMSLGWTLIQYNWCA